MGTPRPRRAFGPGSSLQKRLLVALFSASLLVACGGDSTVQIPDDIFGGGGGQGTRPDTQGGAPDGRSDAGGDASEEARTGWISVGPAARPARVYLPEAHADGGDWPLILLLHGRSVTGAVQDTYFGVSDQAERLGYVLAAPDGSRSDDGVTYWNATPACCSYDPDGPDDAAYLIDLVAELVAGYRIDADRVFILGHSNGGFMGLRLACEHADTFAAVASFAGAVTGEAADCAPARPVSVLLAHGTEDSVIPYDGTASYPSAAEGAARWAGYDACAEPPTEAAGSLDLDGSAPGAETDTRTWSGCAEGRSVVLWTMRGSGHIPNITNDMKRGLVEWLLDQGRTASP